MKFPEIKELSVENLSAYATQVRDFIMQKVTQNGGHLSSNLGIVELTIALHYVFSSPQDKIIFDVSHLSDKSFWDLIEIAKKPVIATHSNFRAVSNHSRNLTDDMAKALIDKGGVVGLNFHPKFVNEIPEEQTIAGLFKHLDYCLENFGENGIGFGGDIDGTSGRYPRDFDISYSIHDQLIDFMQKHYSESIVEKVAGGNYLNFLKNNL